MSYTDLQQAVDQLRASNAALSDQVIAADADAREARLGAETARTGAQAAQVAAETAKLQAESFKVEAQAAATSAAGHRVSAEAAVVEASDQVGASALEAARAEVARDQAALVALGADNAKLLSVAKVYDKPSLALDFTRGELWKRGKYPWSEEPAALQFSRSTPKWVFGADGLLTEVAPDVPAYGFDFATREPLGLSIEGGDTNYFPESNGDVALWNTVNATVTRAPSSDIGPDFPAYRVEAAESDGLYTLYLRKRFSIPESGVDREIHMVVRTHGVETIRFKDGYAVRYNVDRDLVAGAEGVEDLGNGYFSLRLSVSNLHHTIDFQIYGLNADRSASPVGAAFDICYIGVTERPSTPILTTGSAATRGSDIADVALGDEYRADEGTWVASVEGGTTEDGVAFILGSEKVNYAPLGITKYGYLYTDLREFGGVQKTSDVGHKEPEARVAISYSPGEAVFARNGTDIDNSLVLHDKYPRPMATLLLGRRAGNTLFLNGYIKSVRFYPHAMTEAELIEVTS